MRDGFEGKVFQIFKYIDCGIHTQYVITLNQIHCCNCLCKLFETNKEALMKIYIQITCSIHYSIYIITYYKTMSTSIYACNMVYIFH